jgi:hypothetical protein
VSQTVEHPVEVELKFRVLDLAAAERYLVADEIGSFSGVAAARASQFEDRYVDTADGAMAKAGFAVRIRQTGRGTVVSVKGLARTAGAGGSIRREELEGPADRTSGPLEWPSSDARSLILERAGDAPLLELVTIRQLRRKRVVRDGETRVELSLDEVDVVQRSRVIDRFVELEAELVKGDEERLVGLAEVFSADPGLAQATGSKLDVAMAAVRSGGRGGPNGAPDYGAAEAFVPTAKPPSGPKKGGSGEAPNGDEAGQAADAAGTAEVKEPAAPPDPQDVTPTSSDVVSEAIDETLSADARLVVGMSPGVTADDLVAVDGR